MACGEKQSALPSEEQNHKLLGAFVSQRDAFACHLLGLCISVSLHCKDEMICSVIEFASHNPIPEFKKFHSSIVVFSKIAYRMILNHFWTPSWCPPGQ